MIQWLMYEKPGYRVSGIQDGWIQRFKQLHEVSVFLFLHLSVLPSSALTLISGKTYPAALSVPYSSR